MHIGSLSRVTVLKLVSSTIWPAFFSTLLALFHGCPRTSRAQSPTRELFCRVHLGSAKVQPALLTMAASRENQSQAALQVDDDIDNDGDSLLNSVLSSTASMTSSILRFRQENGRTYHAYKDGGNYETFILLQRTGKTDRLCQLISIRTTTKRLTGKFIFSLLTVGLC